MTPHALLSPQAKLDLDAIWNHSSSNWGPDRAERYIRHLWRQAKELATQPSLGRSCDEIRDGYRKFRSGSHILFYRLTEGGIEIIRILHERMDVDRHF